MLQGAVLDAMMVDRAMEIAPDFAGEAGVTNALTVASPQQVMLEVRMIEASRSLGRDLGVNWSVARWRFPLLHPAGRRPCIGGYPSALSSPISWPAAPASTC
jgi:Flp pilus assembly secretin CpaC